MDVSKLDMYIEIGAKDINWYKECMNLFIDLFGVEHLRMITQLFAATSINSSLKSNVQLFRRALYEIVNGLPIGEYVPVMKMQIERIRRGEEIQGQKIRAFARAMAGDINAVVVDIWLLRAFDEDRQYLRTLSGRKQSGGATQKQFELIEFTVREKAALINLNPCQVSAMIWSGCRIYHTGDYNTHYKEYLLQHFNNLFNVI